MGTNYKFHAIAIGSICLIITVLFFLIGPGAKPATPDVAQAGQGYTIEIYSATWGANCNTAIASDLRERGGRPLITDEQGKIIEGAAPKMVETNNLLVPLGRRCNGKPFCDVLAASDILGIEPMETCYKRLAVSYRCFSYDRLRVIEVGQGETLRINCREALAQPAAK
jgi:hypothetical protein